MGNTKKYVVIAVAIAIVIGVGASFSSYLGQIEENQKLDALREDGVPVGKGSTALGLETATVTIVEIGDYQCEMCKRWYDNTRPMIIENFVDTGKANLVFLDLPIFGNDSKIAAQASYCADDQNKYWDYHEMLYDYQGELFSGWANVDRLHSFAFNLDLDMNEFEECLISGKHEMRIKLNAERAGYVADGTPTFLIINTSGVQEKIVGAQPYIVFERIIESLL